MSKTTTMNALLEATESLLSDPAGYSAADAEELVSGLKAFAAAELRSGPRAKLLARATEVRRVAGQYKPV